MLRVFSEDADPPSSWNLPDTILFIFTFIYHGLLLRRHGQFLYLLPTFLVGFVNNSTKASVKSVVWQCINCPILPGLLRIQQTGSLIGAMDEQLGEEDLCWDLSISSLLHPHLHREGSEAFQWLPPAACGKVSLSLSLSGRISSSATLLPDMVLANLETSARVTSLLILLQENIYEYSDRRTGINPHSNLQITSLPWGPLLSGFQFQWKLSVISFSQLEIAPGR